jgi:hypothetical protein
MKTLVNDLAEIYARHLLNTCIVLPLHQNYWAAAEDCHVPHIWKKMVRIHATYHTLQINNHHTAMREDSAVHAHTPAAVHLSGSSETVSILTTGFSCG